MQRPIYPSDLSRILGTTGRKETGIAKQAEKLKTPRQISLAGDAQGEGSFDGSEDVEIYTTVERLSNSELETMLV